MMKQGTRQSQSSFLPFLFFLRENKCIFLLVRDVGKAGKYNINAALNVKKIKQQLKRAQALF